MMEAALEMEFLRKYLSPEWRVEGYSVTGNTHHVLLRGPSEMRTLSFRTEDAKSDGKAEVTGYEEAVFIE